MNATQRFTTRKGERMNAQKTAAPAAQPPAARTTTTSASTGNRKQWVKRTPVEVVLEQIGKQEEKVTDMRKELAREERELSKLQQAKKLLEAE
jgi:hypothetical protein